MSVNPLAGLLAPPELLVDVDGLVGAYRDVRPDPTVRGQRVAFGTSGHRGSSLKGSFNEAHILATTEAICRYRAARAIDGPLFIGRDTHALSEPAFRSALEVLAAHGAQVCVDAAGRWTPTPAVSHAIIRHNRGRRTGLADGIVVTPSHNPPEDGGFKYNPPSGGPADAEVTGWIQAEANRLLEADLHGVLRTPLDAAGNAPGVAPYDFLGTYVGDLTNVVDLDAVRASGLHLGVDPLGGASVDYWGAIGERFGLDLTVTNERVDPTFRFMTVDWDGRIRMDPSSPHAMAGLLALRDRFDLAFAADTDADRHGIVSRGAGLLNPNHYLAVAIEHLFGGARDWPAATAIGKTLVSSGMIDRVVASLGRRLVEVPVGFKWFVDGLLDGSLGFGGEESAGASFLRFDRGAWSTDKDGILLCLLAAEITARRGRDPGELYADLTTRFGTPAYRRVDAVATAEEKDVLASLSPGQVRASTLAGDPITAVLTTAPGNGAPIGGLKVTTAEAWFAARPSGTEQVYKIYAESFRGDAHLEVVLEEARGVVAAALAGARRPGRAPGSPPNAG